MALITERKIVEKMQTNLQNYLEEYNLKGMTIGISGGLDSALVAAIASPVAMKMKLDLVGMCLPSAQSKPEETIRAKEIARLFCDKHWICPIDVFADPFLKYRAILCPTTKKDKVRRGNIYARTRMILLYDHAGLHNHIVLSTDNLTEYELGYFTINGDVGDFGLIQNIWKSEVYKVTKWIADDLDKQKRPDKAAALRSCIVGTPTDGNGITSSDFEGIGLTGAYSPEEGYKIIDTTLIGYLKLVRVPVTPGIARRLKLSAENPIIKRHIASNFKREHPYNIPRKIFNS